MNEIRDLFPGRMRERTFQLKARRDAGAVWHEPQFVECKQCGRRATRTIWTRSLYVCPNCGYHMPIGGYYRLSLVLDHGSFRELDADLPPQDVLRFPGYPEKLTAAQNKTGLREAAVTATGRIGGVACVAAVLDSRFFMGSMSTAVGEKDHPRGGVRRSQTPAAGHLLGQRRCPHAGGHFQPDADGQDQRRHPALFRQRRAVRQRAHPPHHRRRDRQLCKPGRHHAGRAGGADRLCRAPRH